MKNKNALTFAVAAGMIAAAATVWFLTERRKRTGNEKPPRKAPQVHIHNPGEQSEFSTSPEEAEFER